MTRPRGEVGNNGAIACIVVVTVAAHLPLFLTAALSSFIATDLGLTEIDFGLAFSSYFVVSALFSPVAGRLAESWGVTVAFMGALVLSATSLIGMAAGSSSKVAVAGFLMVGGIGAALSQPASSEALLRFAAARGQGLAFGIKQGAIPSASMLAGIAVPLLSATQSWQATMAVGSAASCVALLAVVPFRSAGKPPYADGERRGAEPRPIPDLDLLLWLAGAAMFSAAPSAAAISFLVLSSVERGMTPAEAGLVLAVASVGGVVTRVLLGWLADRDAVTGLKAVAGCVYLGGVGFGFLAVATTAPLIAIAAVVGLSAGWGWSGLYAFSVVRRYSGLASRVTGITQSGMYLGGLFGPAAFGLMANRWSYVSAWLAAALSAAIGGTLLLVVRRGFRRRRETSPVRECRSKRKA